MLLTMKALNEGGRAFSSYVAMQLDTAKYSEDAVTRKRAEELVALLTPVAKAFLTDMGLETTIHGQQIFGGHGFIREWGQEQLVRDRGVELLLDLLVGARQDQATARTAQGLVGGGGDHVGERHRVRVDASGDQAGDVGHVDEQVGADLVCDGAEAGEIEDLGIGGEAGDDHLRLVLHGQALMTPLPGAHAMKPGSAAKPFFGVVPALVDNLGNLIEGAAEGNLVILDSWPGQARTLFGDHDRFVDTYFKTFKGMYFTGDGARRDEDGYYWITGRVDDVLKGGSARPRQRRVVLLNYPLYVVQCG